MASFIRTAQRTFISAASKTLTNDSPSPASLLQFKTYATCKTHESPFTANIIRILSNEIEYQHDYAPPSDRPGEKWMTMRARYGDNEDIKIETTMFDGCAFVPKPGEDSTGENMVLHISLFVDISKGQGYPEMEILRSAWLDRLEIHKVHLLNRDKIVINPYMGPDFRKMNGKLQETLLDYLKARGVNNELCRFLHEYVMNKDKIELIQWLRNVKSRMQK
ncbi:zinc finger protein 1-like [Hibiscus syriacus]|uniref:Zinc finger protein 1-like n=1 Tax=Hibiscus syriacus TaxID=106335 RepID=A0A6A3CQ76_HIBSY|nr:zinc finger protein 1-like [Hibiscus syriacus]